jgi:hypothetical protein
VIDAGPEKVHFRVQFTRYRGDGGMIGSYRSLYIVTLKDGRWRSRAARVGRSEGDGVMDADATRTTLRIISYDAMIVDDGKGMVGVVSVMGFAALTHPTVGIGS